MREPKLKQRLGRAQQRKLWLAQRMRRVRACKRNWMLTSRPGFGAGKVALPQTVDQAARAWMRSRLSGRTPRRRKRASRPTRTMTQYAHASLPRTTSRGSATAAASLAALISSPQSTCCAGLSRTQPPWPKRVRTRRSTRGRQRRMSGACKRRLKPPSQTGHGHSRVRLCPSRRQQHHCYPTQSAAADRPLRSLRPRWLTWAPTLRPAPVVRHLWLVSARKRSSRSTCKRPWKLPWLIDPRHLEPRRRPTRRWRRPCCPNQSSAARLLRSSRPCRLMCVRVWTRPPTLRLAREAVRSQRPVRARAQSRALPGGRRSSPPQIDPWRLPPHPRLIWKRRHPCFAVRSAMARPLRSLRLRLLAWISRSLAPGLVLGPAASPPPHLRCSRCRPRWWATAAFTALHRRMALMRKTRATASHILRRE
mmetsp:Transcript_10438/g.31013  ORF Transcript_10438/g.31013 Transcript_10438/m.31013 type:complete len:421 (-) Transcript_10438:2847-4109(-)